MPAVSSEKEQPVLSEKSVFHFACHDNLPCFTQCCKDVNIYLTPYDVLRLRRDVKLGSGEFLARYTRHFLAKVSHIPVVQLAMDPKTLYCQFVTDRGCSVYHNRPWACRMYPLDLTAHSGQYRTIVGHERCFGLSERASSTAEEWLEGQGVKPYVEMELLFQRVFPAGFKPSDGMEAGLGKLLYLAYDLDRFAAIVNDPRFPNFYELEEAMLQQVREDDEAMLKLAFVYIRSQVEELFPVL